MTAFETLADGYGLVEGPRPDGRGGVLFSDVVGGGVRRWTPGGIELVVPGRRGVGGLVLHADGRPVVAGRDLDHGGRTVLSRPEGVTGFNDLSTTDDGGVLAGALRFRPMAGEPPVPGDLWLVPPAAAGTEPRLLADGILWPNGIGLSPAGDVLYVSDFAAGEVLAFDPDGGGRRVLARAPAGAPDGLAVDAQGGVWVALGPAGQVARLNAEGGLDALLDVPADFVASVAFDGDELLVATAGALLRTPAGVPGRPVAPATV
jgi:sugar lactone lactonase YvrE